MIFNLKNPISRTVIKMLCKLPETFVVIYTVRNADNLASVTVGEDFIYIVGTFVVLAAIGVLLAC